MKPSTIIFTTLLFITSACNESDLSLIHHVSGVQTFNIDQVKLLEGPFKKATDLNRKSLMNYNIDRLLAKFRIEAGLKPIAEHYHGWEDDTIAGHTLGHHLSACALMYQTTGEEIFLKRVEHIVRELKLCQDADGDGYIGAFPNGKQIFEEEISKGDIRSQSFSLNGLWAPFYTQHKVLSGLRDAYRLCKIDEALNISRNFVNWLKKVIDPLSYSQVQKMLECEHGGMNEMLVDLYIDTHDKKYLDMSMVFHHAAILDSLANQNDILPGIHGNTQVPKLIGLAKRYGVTKDEIDLNAAQFFWDRVVNHHSYVTGGHGNHEYFGQPDQLRNRLSDNTTETCNVYNMLKLSSLLFKINPDAKIADYYERALFNQILSSQHPGDGKVVYNQSLEMGGKKVYQDPEWFTCCVGTGMENHSKYGSDIYYYNEEHIYISQFISSELNWAEKGMMINQITQYPEEQGTTIHINSNQPQKLTISIRYPYWAEQGIQILVNSNQIEIDAKSGSFVDIQRTWKSGDIIKVIFPFSLRLETMPDDQNRVAFMYGPLVMAGDLGPENDPDAYGFEYVPVLLTEIRNPNKWSTANKVNEFNINSVGHPRDFTLIPLYKMHNRRYSVYWDIYNNDRWQEHQKQYQKYLARNLKLDSSTYDIVRPGDNILEKSHNIEGEKTELITHQNKKARHANRGGWFSYIMEVIEGGKMLIAVEYWGGFTGSKTFDIKINDNIIATENISSKKDGHYIIEKYKIPEELIKTENNVKVSFVPHDGHRAGPVFSLRTIKE